MREAAGLPLQLFSQRYSQSGDQKSEIGIVIDYFCTDSTDSLMRSTVDWHLHPEH